MNDLVSRESVSDILAHSIHEDSDYREANKLLYNLPVVFLEKIRSEIEQLQTYLLYVGDEYKKVELEDVLEIIDRQMCK